jgi:hypothetical protein
MSSLKKSLGIDLPALAEMIRSKGRSGDSILAHISPKEAALLKKRGGSGTTNPDTGLLEFYDGESYDIGFGPDTYTPEVQPADIQGTTFTPQEAQYYGYSNSPNIYSGENITLPGEGGDISAFQPNVPGMQPLLQTSATAPNYGFNNIPASQLPATNIETPSAAELKSLQVGGPQDVGTEATSKSLLDKLGISGKDALRLGVGATLAGGLTAQNIARTRQAGQQAQAAKGELSAMAAPYREAGAKLTGAAQRGELTPANQQALQAARAQVNQGIAQRGGVGAQQAANQIANLQALLLQNQYDYGIKVSNIGDQYALGAIKSGMEADRAIGAANQQFYGQLAQMIAPFITGVPNRIV